MAAYDFAATRLFVEAPLAADARVSISGDHANRLLNVLRLRNGADIRVFNGIDGEWHATLTDTTRKSTVLHIAEQLRPQVSGPNIDYCFAPLKHARLDYLVQKATEMGARRLRPILTRRTQVSRINTDRMRANVIEAAEQCGVLALPDVLEETTLERALRDWDVERQLVFCDEDSPIADPLAVLRNVSVAQKWALLIGPEGGFDESERAALLAHPATTAISLGPRILRADTAGVAALALLQAIHGDWHGSRPSDTISPR